MNQFDEIVASPPTPKRRWYQFSLRTLLIFMLVTSMALGVFGKKAAQVRRQRIAIDAITKSKGHVTWDFETEIESISPKTVSREPNFLRTLLGDDFFDKAVDVSVSDNADMDYLKDFPDLARLDIQCFGNLSDAGLERLRDVPKLQEFSIGLWRHIRGEGFANMKYLSELRLLYVPYLNLHDDFLEHVQSLSHLQELHIRGDFSAEGLDKLRSALPNCSIRVMQTKKPADVSVVPLADVPEDN